MKLRSLLAAAIISAPFAANAAPANTGISYNYAEASYQIFTDPDLHNWALKGSYQVADQFYITAEDDYLIHGRSGGVGFFAPLDNTLHLYGQFSLADSAEYYGKKGIRPVVEGGVRAALNNELEVRGAMRYATKSAVNSRGKVKDELFFQAEGQYKFNNQLAAVAGLAIPVEADGVVLNMGARFSF